MLGPVLAAALAASPRIAVLPFRAPAGTSTSAAEDLSQAVASAAWSARGAEIVARADVDRVLQRNGSPACAAVACAVEVGRTLGVDRVLFGEVARLGDDLVITLQAVSTDGTRAMPSFARVRVGNAQDARDAARRLVTDLLAPQGEPAPGGLPARASPPTTPSDAAHPSDALAIMDSNHRLPGAPIVPTALPVPAPSGLTDFAPPPGLIVVHLRGPAGRLRLVAWSEELSEEGTRVFRKYLTPWDQAIEPSGESAFGSYWVLPASEVRGGILGIGLMLADHLSPGRSPVQAIGENCCGARWAALRGYRQVWIDPNECWLRVIRPASGGD